jgi:hypothetical protein
VVLVHGGADVAERGAGRRTPYAGKTADAASGNAVDSANADESFFHEADKVDGAQTVAAVGVAEAAEVKDGVADELAGTVVGDVAAAVDVVEGDTTAREQFIGGQDVGAIGVAAKGENGGVLEEEEDVFNTALEAEVDQLGLEAKAFVVGDAAEIEVLNHGCFDSNDPAGCSDILSHPFPQKTRKWMGHHSISAKPGTTLKDR